VVRVEALVRYGISTTGGAVKSGVEKLKLVVPGGGTVEPDSGNMSDGVGTRRNSSDLLKAAKDYLGLVEGLEFPWWAANQAGLTLIPESTEHAGRRVSMLLGAHLERLAAINADTNAPCQVFTDTVLLHLQPLPPLQGFLAALFCLSWFILTIHLLASGSALRRTSPRWQWRVLAIPTSPLRLGTDIAELLVSETQNLGGLSEAYDVEPHLSHLQVRFGEDRRTRGERVGHLRVGMVHEICKLNVDRQYY
ncbi:hypothetical protein HK097_007856, partial [Rhizophlyctis rosea]